MHIGPFIDMIRDAGIKFPKNYQGELPASFSREELLKLLSPGFKKRNLTEEQVEEALNYFETYENRYYEDMASGGQKNFHRACNGGAVVQGNTGIFCSKCGKLEDLLPPKFLGIG